MKKSIDPNSEVIRHWLIVEHGDYVNALLSQYTKDGTAKLLRDYFYSQGITHHQRIPLHRAMIRAALRSIPRSGAARWVE